MSATVRNTGDNIQIFALTVKLKPHARPFKSASFALNKEPKQVEWIIKGKRTFEVTFEDALHITASDQLNIRLHRSIQLGSSSLFETDEDIHIDGNQISANTREDGDIRGKFCMTARLSKFEWRQSFDGTEITLKLSPALLSPHHSTPKAQDTLLPAPSSEQRESSQGKLIPTTDDIIRICPRFRILIVGKAGVGKSSLINEAFGVDTAKVSHDKPGEADINKEIFSEEQNARFVLHDSQGFEPGEEENFQKVQDFIKRRNNMPELKEKLHAIWLCFEIPTEGGRLLETGDEKLLNMKKKGHLGQVPIIAVFTKYDDLVERENYDIDESDPEYKGLGEEGIARLADQKAGETLIMTCIDPLKKVVDDIPYKAVSVRHPYQNTLRELIKITYDNVHEHVAKEASIITAIAQKVDPNVKIEGSIEVGKSKYWAGLASSLNFPGRQLLECVDVIHTDILVVWGFKDPYMHLRSSEFKALMSNMVADTSVGDPYVGLRVGLPVIGTIAGVVAALAGPVAPIVIPIVAGLVFSKWVYDVYQCSQSTLERLMEYIVDLTLVMQHLFCVMQGDHQTVSRRLIKLAYNCYYQSGLKSQAHTMIKEHTKNTKLFLPGARDSTFDKITEIIGLFTINSADLTKLQTTIAGMDVSGDDEPW